MIPILIPPHRSSGTLSRSTQLYNPITKSPWMSSIWNYFITSQKLQPYLLWWALPQPALFFLSSIASIFSTLAFHKFIWLAISAVFVTGITAQFLSIISAFIYFAPLTPRLTFITVSPVTPLGPDKYHMLHSILLIFWQIWISKWHSPSVIVVLLFCLYFWV